MQFRELGQAGWKVSTISFGTWAIGASGAPSMIGNLSPRFGYWDGNS